MGIINFQDDFTRKVTAAKAIYVPSNYTSIQTAIDNANPGDTIYVWSGTYYENVLVNKTVSLIGNGSEDTIIDGGGVGDVIRIVANGVNVSGFKIVNSGNKNSPDYDSGIELDGVKTAKIGNNYCSNNNIGIYLYNSNSNIIKNNTCKFNNLQGIGLMCSNLNNIMNNTCCKTYIYCGIYINASDSNTIINNKCNSNNWSGIRLVNSHFNKLTKNICNFNGWQGIYIYNSNSNKIENSFCKSNLNNGGILVSNSKSNVVVNNTCALNNKFGIWSSHSISTTILNNTMSYCGLVLDGNDPEHYNSHTIDASNTVNGKPVYYWKFCDGGIIPGDAGEVILVNCTNVQVTNLTLENVNLSIALICSSFNTVTNNVLLNNSFAIFLHFSDSNLIANNTAKFGDDAGIHILSSSSNTIINNTCNSNLKSGIGLKDSNKNSIINNSISSNKLDGIYLNTSHNNVVFGNYIYANKKNGLRINNSNKNIIYHNDFINNTIQGIEVGISKNNQWDNGNFEGNYWSDYNGLDNGANHRIAGDGIGDTEIPHLGLDEYPFVNSSGWLFPGIPFLVDPGDYSSDGNYSIFWYPNRGTTKYVLEEDTTKDFNSPTVIYEGSDQRFYGINKPNGTYYYRLKALSEKFKGPWSNIVDITVDWPPDKPQNLTVSVFPEGNTLNISWNINTVDIELYELFYKSDKMNKWELLASITHPEHWFNHTNLQNDIRYYYKLQALDARGQHSGFSDIVSGIPKDSVAPAAPNGLSIMDITNDSIGLKWNANPEDDIEGYNIYRYTLATPHGWGDLIGTVSAGNETFLDQSLIELMTYFYVITAYDEVPNESNFSVVVSGTTKLGPHGPEINKPVADFSFNEDSINSSSINLYSWFKDINSDPLIFWCEGQKYINVTIFQENGTVILIPSNNWHGSETLIFYASDGIFECFDDVHVSVNPINDPPGRPIILEPENNLEIYPGTLLNFSSMCTDVDLPEDDLTFQWRSSIQGQLGLGENLTNIELEPGVHNITLIVTDQENANSSVQITIIVLETAESTKKGKYIADLMIGAISGLIILIILLSILFIFLLKKRKEQTESSKAIEPSTSRFSFLSIHVSDTSLGKQLGITSNQELKVKKFHKKGK